MLDDIDYSALNAEEPVAEKPKAKAGVSSRSVTKSEAKKKVDVEALSQKAESMQDQMGSPVIPDMLAQYGLPGLGILGGLAAAYGMWQKGKANASYDSGVKPSDLSVPADKKGQSAVSSVEQNVLQAETPQQMSPMEVLQQRKEMIMGRKQNVAQSAIPPAGPTYNVPTANAPQIGIQVPTTAPVQAPVGAVPPAPAAPAIADAVAAGQSPAQAIQMDVAKQIEALPVTQETGVKKRAAKTPVSFKSAEKLPEGVSFRADLGPGDNWLYNTYGAEGRKAILGQFNEGKPAVSYERAKELSQMVQQGRTGPVIPRDIAKERGIAPPETNYGKLGKAVKVAGAAGLALTAAQMAQAAQQAQKGDYSGAREFGFNLLGMIPGLGTAFNLGTYAPELGVGEQEELAKRWKKGSSVKAQPTID